MIRLASAAVRKSFHPPLLTSPPSAAPTPGLSTPRARFRFGLDFRFVSGESVPVGECVFCGLGVVVCVVVLAALLALLISGGSVCVRARGGGADEARAGRKPRRARAALPPLLPSVPDRARAALHNLALFGFYFCCGVIDSRDARTSLFTANQPIGARAGGGT